MKNEMLCNCMPLRGLVKLLCPFNVVSGQRQRLKKTFVLYSVSYIPGKSFPSIKHMSYDCALLSTLSVQAK